MATVLLGGCTDGMVVVPEEETTGGESGSSDVTSVGALDTSGGEPGGTGIEPGGTGSEPGDTSGEPESTGSESGDTGIEPGCGNGIVEVGEACEGTDLAGGTCEDLGFGAGMLACDDECEYETSGCAILPPLELSFSQIKRFDFSWAAVPGAEYYQVLESPAPGEPYEQLGGDIVGESASFEMPLCFRWQASYVLRACDAVGCTDSAAVDVMGSLAEAVGYIKASNTGGNDQFGHSVSLSRDGNTLAVGAFYEESGATGIGGNQADDSVIASGAVYVFIRDAAGSWSQQAYVKASNTGELDSFGYSVALSEDGNTLAVSARYEDSSATGIGGNQADDSASNSGAVYVFVRDGAGAWSQQAYVKASNTGENDHFGAIVALSGDGNILAVGSPHESSNATGIDGNQADDSASSSGAVYVFLRDGAGVWSQQAYVKGSNTGTGDQLGVSVALSGDGNALAAGSGAGQSGAVYVFVREGAGEWSQQAQVEASNGEAGDGFGGSVALSGDGSTLAVGARTEESSATGIGGDQADNTAEDSGAVYVFASNGAGVWSQQAYVKASNTGEDDRFGGSVTLSSDGNTLAVGAIFERSNAPGIGGNQADDSAEDAGAVYVFVRDGAMAWSQQAYVKTSNPEEGSRFGESVALSGDGDTLAASASWENSSATGIGGNQAAGGAVNSGAVYLY